MRLGALLEGGSLAGPWPSGDHGVSHGPFQINSSVHPVSYAQANDPAYAVAYMQQKYRDGVAKVPSALWQSNPAGAAALAAYYAEAPAVMYPLDRVTAAFSKIAAWLTGEGKTNETIPVVFGIPNPFDGITIPNPFDGAGALVAALADPETWKRVIAVIAGVVFIVAGVFMAIN